MNHSPIVWALAQGFTAYSLGALLVLAAATLGGSINPSRDHAERRSTTSTLRFGVGMTPCSHPFGAEFSQWAVGR